MRRTLFFILACLASLAGSSAFAAPPNIVLFLADDLGQRDLGCAPSAAIRRGKWKLIERFEDNRVELLPFSTHTGLTLALQNTLP